MKKPKCARVKRSTWSYITAKGQSLGSSKGQPRARQSCFFPLLYFAFSHYNAYSWISCHVLFKPFCIIMHIHEHLVMYWQNVVHRRRERQTTSVFLPWEPHESESEVAQSCPTLCDPMDCSLPGSSVYGIHQARILEWITVPFSRGIFPTQRLNPDLPHWRWIIYIWATKACLMGMPAWACSALEFIPRHSKSSWRWQVFGYLDTGWVSPGPLWL